MPKFPRIAGALRRHPSKRRRMDWLRDLVLPGTNWCGTGCCGYDPQRYNTCATGTLDSACRLHDHCRARHIGLRTREPLAVPRSARPAAHGSVAIRQCDSHEHDIRVTAWREVRHGQTRLQHVRQRDAVGVGDAAGVGAVAGSPSIDQRFTSASTSVGLVWYAPRCGGNS